MIGSRIEQYQITAHLFHLRVVGSGSDAKMGIQFDVASDGRFLVNLLRDNPL